MPTEKIEEVHHWLCGVVAAAGGVAPVVVSPLLSSARLGAFYSCGAGQGMSLVHQGLGSYLGVVGFVELQVGVH